MKQPIYPRSTVFISCFEDTHYSRETFVRDHVLMTILTGEMKVVTADQTFTFKPNDVALFPRNSLLKIIKYPVDGQPYRSASIHLTRELLEKYYITHEPHKSPKSNQHITVFDKHPLLESLFNSLVPYFSLDDQLPQNIAAGKVEEAISILRSIAPQIDTTLAHFEQPGKVDLAEFMEKNYMHNLTLERFGFLTGRSLSTFKRDFKKEFNTTPQKWLTQRRLKLAHHLLTENNSKPSDICYEVGFENLSHFSFAFKKEYGYSPTSLAFQTKQL